MYKECIINNSSVHCFQKNCLNVIVDRTIPEKCMEVPLFFNVYYQNAKSDNRVTVQEAPSGQHPKIRKDGTS